ncbi:MAG: hypothetical protein R3F56_06835 [Planctomycetota bacterium]
MKHRSDDATAPERGFSLVEALFAMTFLLPMLGGIISLTAGLTRAVDTRSTSTQVQALAQRAFQVMATFVQAAKMSTLRTQAVATDVGSGAATYVGEWIGPTDLVWRPGIEFLSASGLLSMNARLTTSTRRVVFTREITELANGNDDDGDGLIDEGNITLLHESTEVAVVRNVEQCDFELEGRTLRMRMTVARRAGDGRIERAHLERSIYLRNN